MEINEFIHESLDKLQKLGIDALAAEKEIANQFLFKPDEELEAMEPEQILGVILSSIGAGFYPGTEQMIHELYVFDMEVPDILRMYTVFLEGISRIARGSLEITDIEEEVSEETLETGMGTQTVRFRCNGTAYEYNARFHNNWFDVRMIAFMNRVIGEQNTGSHLYVTSDGYQDCIVLYRTEEWAEQFRQLFDMELDRP